MQRYTKVWETFFASEGDAFAVTIEKLRGLFRNFSYPTFSVISVVVFTTLISWEKVMFS